MTRCEDGAFGKVGILGLLLCLLLWLLLLAGKIYSYSLVSDSSPADAAIVLGAAIWDRHPSPVFQERINHAVTLYHTGVVQSIIFTGGVGAGESYAESEVARDYAIREGVSAGHIHIETSSRTTYQNLVEAERVVDQQGWGRVLIVSDPLHMRRAIVMARDLGMDAHPSPTPTTRYRTWGSKLEFLARELYFYATYLLRRPFAR